MRRGTALVRMQATLFLAAAAGAADLRFEDVTATVGLEPFLKDWRLGHSASWGDLNADGYPDLFVGAFASVPRWTDGPMPNMLFFSGEGKRFRLSPQEDLRFDRLHARPSQTLMADLDQDGDLDMMIACHASSPGQFQSTLWENRGDGSFRNVTPRTGYWPGPMGYRNLAPVDLDGDGLLDIVGCDNNYSNWKTGKGSVLVLLNRGRFTFADGRERYGFPPDGTTGFGLAAGDVNDDGRFDFFVADSNRLFLSGKDGRYRESQPGLFRKPDGRDRESRTCGAVFGDVNSDGLLDLATSEHGGYAQVRLYVQGRGPAGAPVFREVTRECGLEGALPVKGITGLAVKSGNLQVVDMDNDGLRDIWIDLTWKTDDNRIQPLVHRNLGVGTNGLPTFSKAPLDRIVTYYATAPLADFDRDGRLDVFLAAWLKWEEAPSILFRNTTPGGHWLTVRVKGSGKRNTMGVGAVVKAYAAGRAGDPKAFIQRQDIAVGTGYSSGEEALAHLGLGTNRAVDLVIGWGAGTNVVKDCQADRLVVVEWKTP